MTQENEPLEDNIGRVLPYLRLLAACVSLLGIAACVGIIAAYVADPNHYAEPGKIGIANILGFLLALLGLAVFPFERLGLRIKKIGGIEFEEIVKTQVKERVEEAAELRQKIGELEAAVATSLPVSGVDQLSEHVENMDDTLRRLTSDFLKQYKPWAFSPRRIVTWGVTQPGFENFGRYSSSSIRNVLQSLVHSGEARTTVSRKGNTLYKWNDL